MSIKRFFLFEKDMPFLLIPKTPSFFIKRKGFFLIDLLKRFTLLLLNSKTLTVITSK